MIDQHYQKTSQVDLAKWALSMAKHIFDLAKIDYRSINSVIEGFQVNESWQLGKISVHHLRQSGFKIHNFARECEMKCLKPHLELLGMR